MATSKILVFFTLLALLFTTITADPPLPNDGASASTSASAPEVADSSLRLQLELLQLKVSLLESRIDEKNGELSKKDEIIRQMEKIIQQKSNSISLLQSDIESVQGRDSLDVVELSDKSHVQAAGHEKEVKRLREHIIMQNMKNYELEARASIAEQKIQELNLKLKNLHLVVNQNQTHEGWITQTFAVHIGYLQSYVVTYWNELGRPAMDVATEKALEMKAQVQGCAELSIQTIKSKWIPTLKKQSVEFIAYLEPNIQSITTRTVHVYHSSKSSIEPLVFKAQRMADPYIQEAMRFTEPYIDQVAMVTRPHLDKVYVALEPCTKKVLHAYRKFITIAAIYHHEVQEMLKNNELTQTLASMELAWFAATASLALPAVFLLKLYSAIFRKKTKKRSHTSHSNNTRRRLKRSHPESLST